MRRDGTAPRSMPTPHRLRLPLQFLAAVLLVSAGTAAGVPMTVAAQAQDSEKDPPAASAATPGAAARTTSAAAAGQACGSGAGVTVVVDHGTLGGGVHVGCARGTPSSGLVALASAGFSWTGTSRYPDFVCRIDGSPGSDPCVDTPPADAYWSYWYASPGGEWRYSTLGASMRRPEPGGVEGWRFSGAGRQMPAMMPPAREAQPVATGQPDEPAGAAPGRTATRRPSGSASGAAPPRPSVGGSEAKEPADRESPVPEAESGRADDENPAGGERHGLAVGEQRNSASTQQQSDAALPAASDSGSPSVSQDTAAQNVTLEETGSTRNWVIVLVFIALLLAAAAYAVRLRTRPAGRHLGRGAR